MSSVSIRNAYEIAPSAASRGAKAEVRAKALLPVFARAPAVFLELLLLWQGRARQRHELQELDDRLLRDIGISRADVEKEVSKPFWRA